MRRLSSWVMRIICSNDPWSACYQNWADMTEALWWRRSCSLAFIVYSLVKIIYILHLGSVFAEAQSVNNLQSGLGQWIWFPVAALRAAADLCRLQASATLLQHEGHYAADCRSSSITRHADGTSIHNIAGKDHHTLTGPAVAVADSEVWSRKCLMEKTFQNTEVSESHHSAARQLASPGPMPIYRGQAATKHWSHFCQPDVTWQIESIVSSVFC